MSSFLSRSTAPAALSPQESEQRKQQVMQQVREQLALANAQELINKMNEKCFAKCILKPSTSLGSSDESCLTQCTDRYLEAFNVVSRSYTTRLNRERENAQIGQLGDGMGGEGLN
ncbi:hypothetical protein MVLG_05359 [Microbotryum lychnidis-dioicae p1A1 Lamole]|uniref:Mitochondrial import inner membrane translocase subunit n=2 Tax=Microbotryum TaxID=34416 RepID=U5HE08_USTV1|nr:hypothetical protein MVLG_05359 [Microbotryum lychnidis-dioicae p1A1 Lamole]SGY19965.1 BQ5605_C017g08409 [Microbotryum silenes-dioicae]|eukprot:KDE04199.1 hypothetical protein MVLG_05359 [Microbotryum lychnidis-dioicae p1A1 Lamole]